MSEFNRGDRVRRIMSSYDDMKVGSEWVVAEVRLNGRIKVEGRPRYWWDSEYFELVEAHQTQFQPDECVHEESYGNGKVVTANDETEVAIVEFDSGEVEPVSYSKLTKVETPEPSTGVSEAVEELTKVRDKYQELWRRYPKESDVGHRWQSFGIWLDSHISNVIDDGEQTTLGEKEWFPKERIENTEGSGVYVTSDAGLIEQQEQGRPRSVMCDECDHAKHQDRCSASRWSTRQAERIQCTCDSRLRAILLDTETTS